MITKEQIKSILDEEFTEWIEEIFEGLGFETIDIIEELYPENLRGEDRAFVVNVKHEGLPDPYYIAQIINKRHKIPVEWVEEWFEGNEPMVSEIMWESIGMIIDEIRKELRVPVYQYGRTAGYWGIPLEEIEWKYEIPDRLKERIKKGFLQSKEFNDFFAWVRQEYKSIEEYGVYDSLYHALRDYIRNQISYKKIYPFALIKFKNNLPERFIKLVRETVSYWDGQEPWADVYEDYILEDWKREKGERIEQPKGYIKTALQDLIQLIHVLKQG